MLMKLSILFEGCIKIVTFLKAIMAQLKMSTGKLTETVNLKSKITKIKANFTFSHSNYDHHYYNIHIFRHTQYTHYG